MRTDAVVHARHDTVGLLVRGRTPALDARIAMTSPRHLCVSAVTRGELLFGLALKDGPHRLAQVIERFLRQVPTLPWDEAAADRFATIAAALHRAGTPIGPLDTLVAAHAASVGAVLVTDNGRPFARAAAAPGPARPRP